MDDLTTLLHDAVEDVEPTDRLGAIRDQVRPRRSRRWFAVGGAVLASAAVVAAIAVATVPGDGDRPPPAGSPTPSEESPATGSAIAVYYLGDTPAGPALFREFRRTVDADAPSLAEQVSVAPDDPDYRTPWRPGDLLPDTSDGETVRVRIRDASLTRRPAGMSAREAELAVQQVVYTLTADPQRPVAVQFVLDGNPVHQVFGVPTSEPLARAHQLDVLARVNISNPTEGRVVDGHFSANGVASVVEGTILWELRAEDGTVVDDGFTTGTWDPERLTPWETGDIDVSGLAPGTYTFVASESDPSGGAEGFGPTSDTRTVTIR